MTKAIKAANQSTNTTNPVTELEKLPRDIWGIGFSNLLVNLSTTMVYSLSAVFLTTVLGASTTMFGLIDGLVEAIALSVRVASGWTSDHLKKRKPLLYVGYSLSFISRILMALASSVGMYFSARVVDRLSNGLQAAPRDALVGDLAPKSSKGSAFGLRQTLAVVGSLVGPVIVMGLMYISHDNYRFVFWASSIPALLGIVLLFFLVREPPVPTEELDKKRERLSFKLLRELLATRTGYWSLVVLGAVFMMGRFSEGFMILRVKEMGVSQTYIAGVMFVMNLFTAFSAYPMGRLSDKYDRRFLMRFGLIFLISANMFLSMASQWLYGFVGVALWGIQIGVMQTLFMGMVLDYAPEKKYRALAFGVFYCVSGVIHLITNLIAGQLYEAIGSMAPFYYSAVFAGLTFLGTYFMKKPPHHYH